jgi:hypothetical protein
VARKQDGSGAELDGVEAGAEVRDRLRRDLEARGVDPLFADAVLTRVALVSSDASEPSWEAIVEGVEVAYRVHRNGQESLRRSLRDLSELSRLVDDFGGELKKLDEGLKMLAAYLSRMRKQVGSEGRQILH